MLCCGGASALEFPPQPTDLSWLAQRIEPASAPPLGGKMGFLHRSGYSHWLTKLPNTNA